MTILNDKQIKALCIKPSFMLRKEVIDTNGLFPIRNFVEIPSHETEEALKKNKEVDYCGFRTLTEEESNSFKPMIEGFVDQQKREEVINFAPNENGGIDCTTRKIISFGLSSFGYDVRLDRKFKIFTNINSALIDPLNFDEKCLVDFEGDYVIVPPNSYVLGNTVESFNIPNDIQVICVGKSTYARAGVIINVTPIEAGFSGQVVIEISNSTPLPVKVYANMGIAQFLFLQGDSPCEVSYADRNGKYQNQTGITLPKV